MHSLTHAALCPCAKFAEFSEEVGVLCGDNLPRESFAGALPTSGPHSRAQFGGGNQFGQRVCRTPHVDRRVLRHGACVLRLNQEVHRMSQSKGLAEWPTGGSEGGNEKPVNALTHDGSVTIPVADHKRKPGGPAIGDGRCVVSVQKSNGHRWRVPSSGFLEQQTIAITLREPPGEHEVSLHPGALLRRLYSSGHRLRERFVKEGEAA